jgi:hypothetical protein
MDEWANWSLANSVVKRSKIKQGIEESWRNISSSILDRELVVRTICAQQLIVTSTQLLAQLEISLLTVRKRNIIAMNAKRYQDEPVDCVRPIVENTKQLSYIPRDSNGTRTRSVMETMQAKRLVDISVDPTYQLASRLLEARYWYL